MRVSVCPGLLALAFVLVPGAGADFCFFKMPSQAAGSGLEEGVCADLDGDGVPDYAVTDPSDGQVWVYLGTGGGTLVHLENIEVPGGVPFGIDACDFDLDGDVDLIFTEPGFGRLSIAANDGTAFFSIATVVPGLSIPWSVRCCDVDADGDPDLVVAENGGDSVRILFNDGAGGLGSSAIYPAGDGPHALVCEDLDGDGLPDIAVTTTQLGSWEVVVLLNTGAGTFGGATAFPVAQQPVDLVAADVDGDGDLDLATAEANSDLGRVLFNDGAGGFAVSVTYPVPNCPRSLAAGDFDCDGDPDLAFVSSIPGAGMTTLENDGAGAFAVDASSVPLVNPLFVSACDADADGAVDLVVADQVLFKGTGNVQVLSNLSCLAPWAGDTILLACADNPAGSLGLTGTPTVGDVLTFQVDNPLGTQTAGSVPLVALAFGPSSSFLNCQPLVAGWGMAGPGAAGAALLSLGALVWPEPLVGPPWAGPGLPSPVPLAIPPSCQLYGFVFFAQGALLDPVGPVTIGLTEAWMIQIGAL